MKQINLLPGHIRKQQTLKGLIIGGIFGALIGIAGVGLIWGSLQIQVAYLNGKVTDTKNNQAEVAKQLAKAQNEQLLSNGDLKTRVTSLNTLAKTEVKWSRAFQLINTITPRDIHLTTIDYTVTTDPAQIKIGGQAPSNFSFAVMVESLRSNKALSDVEVQGYTFDPTTTAVTFSLTISVPLKQLDYSS